MAAIEFRLSVLVVHHVPGRLRLRAASLKGDARASVEARRRLRCVKGVTGIRINLCTGSVLVEYDRKRLPPADIIGALARRGYAVSQASSDVKGSDTGWIDQVAGVLGRRLACTLVEGMIIAIVGVLA
jgi:copper chaperone CopZ